MDGLDAPSLQRPRLLHKLQLKLSELDRFPLAREGIAFNRLAKETPRVILSKILLAEVILCNLINDAEISTEVSDGDSCSGPPHNSRGSSR